jgi:hypothetical protein
MLFPAEETFPQLKLVGTILIIGFSGVYTWVKSGEMKQEVVDEFANQNNEQKLL